MEGEVAAPSIADLQQQINQMKQIIDANMMMVNNKIEPPLLDETEDQSRYVMTNKKKTTINESYFQTEKTQKLNESG